MKILNINQCHYHRGGAEIVYFNTAQLLKAHGHSVAYFSTSNSSNEVNEYSKYFISSPNFRDFSLLKKIIKSPSYLWNTKASNRLDKLIRDFKPDIAHVHIFYATLTVSILMKLKEHGIPIVHTVHDYRLLCPVNTFLDKNGKLCELCLENRSYYHCLKKRCSDGKISQSVMVMLEAYFWKYFFNPTKYIDHFIFVSNFIQSKHVPLNERYKNKNSKIYNFTEIKQSHNITLKGRYFLFFGRLSQEKGVETLLNAFSGKCNHRLVIAGTGPLREIVEESTKVNKNIEYVGFKSGKELEDLIINASFIILPSEWYENNPMSIIESFSLGKPVIGARIGGITELIKHGTNGYLFESFNQQDFESTIVYADSISNEEYKVFSRGAIDFALNNFEKENHYLQLLKIYTDVIAQKIP
jgi:glycosyltransferase involved in cell wall biosynthesis